MVRLFALLLLGLSLLPGVPASAQVQDEAATRAAFKRLMEEAEAKRPRYTAAEIAVLPQVVGNFAKAEETCAKGEDDNLCAWVGLSYLTGTGVAKDVEKGRKLVFVACGLSNRLACMIYEADNQDYPPAMRELQHPIFLATCDAKRGGGTGCYNAAQQLQIGFDVRQDYPLASFLFTEGCVQGHAKSCGLAAEMAYQGLGRPAQVTDAFELGKEGCDLGDGTSCAMAIMAGQSGKMRALEEGELAKLAQAGCVNGQAMLCDKAAFTAKKKLPDAAAELQSVRFAKIGCEAKRPVSCALYGEALYYGTGVPKDEAAALVAWEQGCAAKHAGSCYNVGAFAYRVQDAARARTFFEKALTLEPGHAAATAALAKLPAR